MRARRVLTNARMPRRTHGHARARACTHARTRRDHGVAVAPFVDAPNAAAVAAAAAEYGYPVMLKSRRMAYDGRGNAVVRSAEGA